MGQDPTRDKNARTVSRAFNISDLHRGAEITRVYDELGARGVLQTALRAAAKTKMEESERKGVITTCVKILASKGHKEDANIVIDAMSGQIGPDVTSELRALVEDELLRTHPMRRPAPKKLL